MFLGMRYHGMTTTEICSRDYACQQDIDAGYLNYILEEALRNMI